MNSKAPTEHSVMNWPGVLLDGGVQMGWATA